MTELEQLMQSEQTVGLVETLHKYYGCNIKVNIGFSSSNCVASIDEINFSVCSHNALKRAGLFTIGDVIRVLNGDELLKVRNLGRKSLSEIKTRILTYGFEHLSTVDKENFFRSAIANNSSKTTT